MPVDGQSTNKKSLRGRVNPLEFGSVPPWNHAVGAVQK